jgi:hypothetical protein
MKSVFSFIFGLALVFFACVPAQDLRAQLPIIKSDTVTLPMSDTVRDSASVHALRDFGPLSLGDTECHTIYLRNGSTDPLIIQSVNTSNGGTDFSARAIPTLPTVLLSGEIISVVDFCFAPKNPVNSEVVCGLDFTYTIGSKTTDRSFQAIGHQIPDTNLQKKCVTSSIDGDLFGPIIIDGDFTRTLTLQSNRYDSLYVVRDPEYYPADDSVFIINGITFPYKLAPLEKKTFTITFSPRSNTPVVKYRYVGKIGWGVFLHVMDTTKNPYYYDQCTEFVYDLPGIAIPPTADTISTSLNAGSTDVLAMISDQYATTQTFHFKNTGTTNLKITGVSLKYGKSFAITDIKPTTTLPFTLAPGESMSVDLTLTSTANGVYYDEVIITAEAGIISMDFQLQGLRKNGTPAKVNDTKSTNEHIALYPNPSTGRIMLALPDKHTTNIRVYDVLGTLIAATSATSSWTWDSHLPAGAYLLEAEGITDDEKPFTDTRRFVIEK